MSFAKRDSDEEEEDDEEGGEAGVRVVGLGSIISPDEDEDDKEQKEEDEEGVDEIVTRDEAEGVVVTVACV